MHSLSITVLYLVLILFCNVIMFFVTYNHVLCFIIFFCLLCDVIVVMYRLMLYDYVLLIICYVCTFHYIFCFPVLFHILDYGMSCSVCIYNVICLCLNILFCFYVSPHVVVINYCTIWIMICVVIYYVGLIIIYCINSNLVL